MPHEICFITNEVDSHWINNRTLDRDCLTSSLTWSHLTDVEHNLKHYKNSINISSLVVKCTGSYNHFCLVVYLY